MTITKTALLAALQHLVPIASKRSENPLTNCLLLGDGMASTGISIRATDQHESALELVDCDGSIAPCCVNAKQFASLVESAGESIEITLNETRVLFSSTFKAEIPFQPADTFPSRSQLKLVAQGVNVEDLAAGIEAVAWAAHTEEDIIRGVHIIGSEISIQCEATRRTEIAIHHRAAIAAPFDIVVPNKFVPGLIKALRRDGAELMTCESAVAVYHANGDWMAPLSSLKYINTSSIEAIPKADVGELAVEPTVNALRMIQSLGSDPKANPVTVKFGATGLAIEFKDANAAYNDVVAGEFKQCRMRMNSNAMLRSLMAMKCDKVMVRHIQPGLVFSDGDLMVITAAMAGVKEGV